MQETGRGAKMLFRTTGRLVTHIARICVGFGAITTTAVTILALCQTPVWVMKILLPLVLWGVASYLIGWGILTVLEKRRELQEDQALRDLIMKNSGWKR